MQLRGNPTDNQADQARVEDMPNLLRELANFQVFEFVKIFLEMSIILVIFQKSWEFADGVTGEMEVGSEHIYKFKLLIKVVPVIKEPDHGGHGSVESVAVLAVGKTVNLRKKRKWKSRLFDLVGNELYSFVGATVHWTDQTKERNRRRRFQFDRRIIDSGRVR